MLERESSTYLAVEVKRSGFVGAAPPLGGLCFVAVDIRSVGEDRIEIFLYRPTMGFKKIAESYKQWS
jgi:hypothetical protein